MLHAPREMHKNITHVFVSIVPNKTSANMMPITFFQVARNSIIWTDKHFSYNSFILFDYVHDPV